MNFHSSDGLAADRSFTAGAVFGTMLIGLGGMCWWVATHGVTTGPTVEAPLMYAAAPPSRVEATSPQRLAAAGRIAPDAHPEVASMDKRSAEARSDGPRPTLGSAGIASREAYGAMGPDAPTMAGARWAPADARPPSVRPRRAPAATAGPETAGSRRGASANEGAAAARSVAAAPAVDRRRPASARRSGSAGADLQVAELHFRFGSADVDPARAQATLAPIVAAVIARRCQRVLVDGHADPTGPQQANLILAWQRAEATRAWLTERGIADDRIVVRSFGAFQPKLAAHQDARAQRRVEVRATGCGAGEGAE